MSSSFSGFYIGKSGLQIAQASLQITGQNIANVNTDGYTRQRLDCYAVGSSANNMRTANPSDLGVGGGVDSDGAMQIRDPYLDVRFRLENAKVGDTSTQLGALNDLENVLDEISNKGLDSQFKDLISKLQTLASNPNDPVVENIVKTSSLLLVQSFNNTAKQIDQIRDQQIYSLQHENMDKANNLLQNIAHINQQIKSADISGTPALELLDQRNMMIDELSQFANIEVSTRIVTVGGGRTVPELSIDMVSGDQKFSLLNDDKCRQFDLIKDNDGLVTSPVTILLKNSDGTPASYSNDGSVTLTDGKINDYISSGSFSGFLKTLNGKGTFANGTESTERGISYYRGLLDNLAQSFADIMNTTNSTESNSINKPLFTASDGTTTTGINAANISIASSWENASGSYITSTKNSGEAGSNILNMISQFSIKRTYTVDGTKSGTPLFNGTFQECVSNISSTLGLHIQDIKRQNTTYGSTVLDIAKQRASVSSVDINEEGINLLMYKKALTASSRFMTTLDEALDTIINRMGVVGR